MSWCAKSCMKTVKTTSTPMSSTKSVRISEIPPTLITAMSTLKLKPQAVTETHGSPIARKTATSAKRAVSSETSSKKWRPSVELNGC